MSTHQTLILTQKAEVKLGKLSGEVTLASIQSYFKKKTEVEVLGTYKYKSLTLFLFGFTKGKKGTENKHELPPPHEGVTYGDILLIASKDENSFSCPVPFKVEDYEQFYSKVFGGFDEDDDEEEEVELEEPEVELDIDAEVEGVIDEEFEVASHCSEEVIEVKKEKKKKASAAQNITFSQYIPPDKQLTSSSIRNEFRTFVVEKCIVLFKDTLTYDECSDLENEIYKASLHEADEKHIVKDWSINLYESIYKTLLRKIISNLWDKSYAKNNELMERYKKKEVTFQEICSMNHYVLYMSKWSERIEHQKLIEKRQLEGNKSMATDQFLCTRCFKRECTYYEMQTRSADEPMTIFINCLNCGQNWRQ